MGAKILDTMCSTIPRIHCLLPTAYCLLPTAYCLLPTAYCLLPTAIRITLCGRFLLPSLWSACVT